jgi:hypothetical protein
MDKTTTWRDDDGRVRAKTCGGNADDETSTDSERVTLKISALTALMRLAIRYRDADQIRWCAEQLIEAIAELPAPEVQP